MQLKKHFQFLALSEKSFPTLFPHENSIYCRNVFQLIINDSNLLNEIFIISYFTCELRINPPKGFPSATGKLLQFARRDNFELFFFPTIFLSGLIQDSFFTISKENFSVRGKENFQFFSRK